GGGGRCGGEVTDAEEDHEAQADGACPQPAGAGAEQPEEHGGGDRGADAPGQLVDRQGRSGGADGGEFDDEGVDHRALQDLGQGGNGDRGRQHAGPGAGGDDGGPPPQPEGGCPGGGGGAQHVAVGDAAGDQGEWRLPGGDQDGVEGEEHSGDPGGQVQGAGDVDRERDREDLAAEHERRVEGGDS